jgi:hyaluronoglucosaminidase
MTAFPMRGVIEGFYGAPWSHAERLDMIAFCAQHDLNTWVHAPKDDPYHRARWREPYPDDELQRIAELVTKCHELGVEFHYAIAPGLDLCYSHESEWETLVAKLEQVRGVGVRHFQLLWDDVEHKLHCPEDEELYGSAERPTGAAQAPFSNRFAREIEQPGPLIVCPMAYAQTGDGPYRRCFRPDLDRSIVLYWTGPEVVSLGITKDELDMSVHRYAGNEHLLWHNFPVNDWDTTILHLGPARGLDPDLRQGKLRGIIANAMVQAVPSKLGLATVADWAKDPYGYDPLASYERALREHGAEVLAALGDPDPDTQPLDDLAAVTEILKLGVTAPVGAALLRPFVA